MSLNWDVSKIKDYEQNFPDRIALDGTRHWNVVTDVLVWYTMFVDLGYITEANLEEFCFRVYAWDKVCEPLMQVDGKPTSLTVDQIRKHIGIRTNVTPSTRRQFMAKLTKHLEQDFKAWYAKQLKEIQDHATPTVVLPENK